MNTDEVRLPFDDLLLPWAMKHDPEAARIILAVQAKAAAYDKAHQTSRKTHETASPCDDNSSHRVSDQLEYVTKPPDSVCDVESKEVRHRVGRPRQHANHATRQQAYRARKAQEMAVRRGHDAYRADKEGSGLA